MPTATLDPDVATTPDATTDDADTRMVVYKYAILPPKGATCPVSGAVLTQLYLGSVLRNRMVSLWRARDEGKRNLWLTYPDIAAIEAEIAGIEERLDHYTKITAEQRKQQGKRRVDTAEQREVDKLVGRRKELKAASRALKSERAGEAKDRLADLARAERDGLADLYDEFCSRNSDGVLDPRTGQNAVLYWATHNEWKVKMGVAAKRVGALRAEGRPATLRMKPFDGTGFAYVQVMSQSAQVAVWLDGLGNATAATLRQKITELKIKGVDFTQLPQKITTKAQTEAEDLAEDIRQTGAIVRTVLTKPADPPRTPALLAKDDDAPPEERSKWFNTLRFEPWIPPAELAAKVAATPLGRRRRARRHIGTATLTLGSRVGAVRVTVLFHRMLPNEADITGARIVVEAVGPDRDASLHITAKVPKPAPKQVGPIMAVHVGWCRDTEGDDSLRVATWRSTDDLDVPPRLAHVIIRNTPTSGYVRLPEEIRRQINYPDLIRSKRDKSFDRMKERIACWVDAHPGLVAPEWWTRTGAPPDDGDAADDGQPPRISTHVRRWRSPGWIRHLREEWNATPPPDSTDILAEINTWVERDITAWRKEARLRRTAMRHREDIYRCVAALFADHARRIVVDDTDLSKLAKKNPRSETPAAVDKIGSGQRVDAAVSVLLGAIAVASEARGCVVDVVDHKDNTLTHALCGTKNPPDERWLQGRMVRCDGCDHMFDQDGNAVLNMLKAWALPPAA